MAVRNKQYSLKPQDLLVVFKMAGDSSQRLSYAELAKSLEISISEGHACIQRLAQSRLVAIDENGFRLIGSLIYDFIVYGAVYCFPPVMGSITRGVPTGYAASPLKELINQPEELPPVWPDAQGSTRGVALYPLYPSVPNAIKTDSRLYQNLALFDALRAGAAREREIARDLFRTYL